MIRILFLLLGWTALPVGLAGLLLPVIPGTPLLILAAFCFARSSPQLHGWMLNHPRIGPPLTRWQREGSITLRTKKMITLTVIPAFSLSIALLKTAVATILFVMVGFALLVYIWTRPTAPSKDLI